MKPEWLDLPFEEAITWFREKLNIPTETWNEIEGRARDKAFTVAGITREDLLADARKLVDRFIAEGMSFDEFKRQWRRLLGRKGWSTQGNEERRIYLIADTNFRKAYSAGKRRQYEESNLDQRMPYRVWRWRDSPNPREHHKALHNKAILANHPFWQSVGDLPCGFGCRCQAFYANEQTLRLFNAEILENPPDPSLIVDPGFDPTR
ncbi:MAG: phage minor head protein [Microcoleaceae cyanobacterium]